MEKLAEQLHCDLLSMWSRRWYGVAGAVVVSVLGIGVVSVTSEKYQASAQLYVDTQTVLKPLMQGMAFYPNTDQEVRMLARTLISRPNIEQLMKTKGVLERTLDPKEHEREVIRFMDRIKFIPGGGGNLYTITYRDPEPMRARLVVATLLDMFMQSNVSSKKEDSAQAKEFIESQVAMYEDKLAQAENRLKEFKIRNFGLSGVSNQDFFANMSALNDEVNRLRTELNAAERSRDVLRSEIKQENTLAPSVDQAGSSMLAACDADGVLDSQRKQLRQLELRYTEQHPEVAALKGAMARAEAERRECEANARAGRLPAMTTASPVYQRLRISLAEAEANIGALKARLNDQQVELQQAREKASRIPQVEAEFAQLNRDYDILRKNYEQMVSRREAAALGVKMDETSKGAEFRIVEPARVEQRPIFPSRRFMAALVVLVAAAAAVAVSYFTAKLFPSFISESSLKKSINRPVLGVVSLVQTADILRQDRRDKQVFAAALLSVLLLDCSWTGMVALAGW
jgi:polysaccharide chain length determinant protein (PEP-CTERM system associated)